MTTYFVETAMGKVLDFDLTNVSTKQLVLLQRALRLHAVAAQSPLWPRVLKNELDEVRDLSYQIWSELVTRPDRANYTIIPEDHDRLPG